ncbi:MAG: hypothetical protein C0501_20745 [Isosphaera sp.]|nr:hypothetical protein [Isosphaera sp.]
MDLVEMVKSPGYIFGPLMLLAGAAAVVACVRATRRADRTSARRAVTWSLTPIALGIVGAMVGAAVWWLSDRVAPDRLEVWMRLGYVVLFGVFVAAVPLVWSSALLVRRPPAAPA